MTGKLKNQRKANNDGFFTRVYEITKLIPFGRVTSYGAIARYLGTALSARMVGWALNQSHFGEDYIPAHRVVNRNGILTGKHHFGGSKVMQELLESEGIRIEEDKVVDFRKIFWDPSKELI
jgi:methylated-DNA-protein-cysteine methyltransferase-like protein